MNETNAIIVFCTCPDQQIAESISHHLVSEGLAACVNILPGIRSCYLWQGEVETDNELLLVMKTRSDCYQALQAAILNLHPYELPEVIAVPIDRGLPAYLDWISKSTRSS